MDSKIEMKRFENLTKGDLWELRREIVLNSLFVNDYENSFGFSSKSMCDFFESYMEHLWNLAYEEYANPTIDIVFEEFDNADNLYDWYMCYDDFSWVEYTD